MEVDSDNESDSSPEPEPEDLELVEVTDADDLSMLQRLKEGLSQLQAIEPDEHVIHEDMRDSHPVWKDGGRWSRLLDGFFPGTPHEGWYFPSSLSLRRALADSLSTPPVGSSSSAALPTGRGAGRTFYRCEDGYEEEVARVLEAECRWLLPNLRHEARPQAIRDYYATCGIKKQKKDCRRKFLKKEQYMKVPPRWCADKMDCWEALVDEWCTGSWRAVHENVKDRRSQMAHHNKTEMPHLYDLYGMAHTASYKKAKAFSESNLDDPNNFTNMAYRDAGKATKGDDFKPSQEPLDPELVMISGGGRPHGSIAIGDGIIRCPLTLPEIKARQSSSCPEITHRPRPVELAIEAALLKERAANQAALEKESLASQVALDERDQTTAQLIEEERARNEAGQWALYELFVGMCKKSGQVPPLMPVFSSIGTNNSRATSHDPSPGQLSPNEAAASNRGVSPP
ncbi:hypothetical protein ZWY2020_040351 [Hordeum vulgare]|nr:hypothetical protein ZWY2020_040351 [Hordeum vulgare]